MSISDNLSFMIKLQSLVFLMSLIILKSMKNTLNAFLNLGNNLNGFKFERKLETLIR